MKNTGYFSIASGSAGNSSLFFCENTRILIDMGVSVRRIETALKRIGITADMLDAVIVTHEHTDHIKGLGTFAKKYSVPVYMTNGTAHSALKKVPHASNIIRRFSGGESFYIGDVKIKSFLTPHDANESVGYLIYTKDKIFGFATDLGFIPESIKNMLCECDFVVLESNHDINMLKNSDYPYQLKQRVLGNYGHLSNIACAECVASLAENGVKTIVLAHLSEQNNNPVMALRNANKALDINGLKCELFIAPVKEMEKPIFFDMEEDKCLVSG